MLNVENGKRKGAKERRDSLTRRLRQGDFFNSLLSDAEAGEDGVEGIFVGHIAHDFGKGINPEMVIPKPFDPRVVPHVARRVAEAAIQSGVAQIGIPDFDAYEKAVAARIQAANS